LDKVIDVIMELGFNRSKTASSMSLIDIQINFRIFGFKWLIKWESLFDQLIWGQMRLCIFGH